MLLNHELKRRARHVNPQEDFVHGFLVRNDTDGPLGDAVYARYSGPDTLAVPAITQHRSQLPMGTRDRLELLADGAVAGPVRCYQFGSRVGFGWRINTADCCKMHTQCNTGRGYD